MAKTKARRRGIVQAAVDAAEELGQAATEFKNSWAHVRKAQNKAAPATRAAKRAGRTIAGALKKGYRTTSRGVRQTAKGVSNTARRIARRK